MESIEAARIARSAGFVAFSGGDVEPVVRDVESLVHGVGETAAELSWITVIDGQVTPALAKQIAQFDQAVDRVEAILARIGTDQA